MLEDIMEFVEENQKVVLFALGFWVLELLALWVLPSKMGLGSNVVSQMQIDFLWWKISQMTFLNLIISVLALPVNFFIMKKMGAE